MDIAEHVTATDLTALYRDAGRGSEISLAYVALGLVGEASELLEKSVDGDVAGVAAEAGDVLWYVSRLHRECAISPEETFADWPAAPSEERPVGDAAVEVVIAAGRVAEIVKKMIRDDGGELSPARRDAIVVALGRVADAWLALNAAAELDPAETARANIEKLLDRKRRQVLSGSGDDR